MAGGPSARCGPPGAGWDWLGGEVTGQAGGKLRAERQPMSVGVGSALECWGSEEKWALLSGPPGVPGVLTEPGGEGGADSAPFLCKKRLSGSVTRILHTWPLDQVCPFCLEDGGSPEHCPHPFGECRQCHSLTFPIPRPQHAHTRGLLTAPVFKLDAGSSRRQGGPDPGPCRHLSGQALLIPRWHWAHEPGRGCRASGFPSATHGLQQPVLSCRTPQVWSVTVEPLPVPAEGVSARQEEPVAPRKN